MNKKKPTDFEIDPEAIRLQLGKIFASEAFVRAPRMQRFLKFIVEETLAARADQLGEYSIGTAVFDRGPDFEPALDPIVRNDARRLRLKLLEYYHQWASSSSDQWLVEIPKGGYVPLFRPLRPRDATANASSDFRPRIAVLPFEVLFPSPESAMYGRALCLALTANLTDLDGLEAVAHSYLRELTIPQAASEFGLSHAVYGSVLSSSNHFHVIVNLIQLKDGTQLWAHEYDFENSEILTCQREITRNVRGEIAAYLGLRPQRAQLAAVA